ncbi:hypothetical protein [Phenylobacterium sp.]|uniref:hypothetical protein n=1 Tax=Phenylobacterium sp. TaxID=1871053 RepID=UPI002EDB30E4
MILARTFLTVAAATVLATSAAPAAAQTAGDINRLNSAIQICNSPMGAGMAECARLRGQLGGGAGGGQGAAAAGLLGALNAAMSSRAPSVAAPVAPAANSQAIAACVRNAAGDAALIQACLAAPATPRLAAPGVPALGQPIMPSAGQGHDTASAIHRAGQSYHACVAANPGAWQSCVHLLNGGQPR